MSDQFATRVQSPPPSAGSQWLSKEFYLGSVAIGLGIGVILRTLGTISSAGFGMHLMGLAVVPSLYGGIVMLVLWYKAWASIQDGYARTTPGKAIGFLFIPVFDIYWAFQAIWGFAQDFNRYIQRHGIMTEPLPEGLFLTNVILGIALAFIGRIPMLSILLVIANFVIGLIMVSKICDGVNAINGAAPSQ